MNEKVATFLNKNDQIIKKDRDDFLIELGLVQKVYSPDNCKTYEYSKSEYVNGEDKYYKVIALDVTDEEYLEILKRVKLIEEIETRKSNETKLKYDYNYLQALTPILSKEPDTNKDKFVLSDAFRVLAWMTWFLGFISGLIALFEVYTLMFIIWASAFLLGIFMYAIAQVLEYLSIITTYLKQGYKITKIKK